MKIPAHTALMLAALLNLPVQGASEFTGKVTAEGRFFIQDAIDPQQTDQQFSLAIEAEYFTDWNDGNDSLVFKPFFRFDSEDDQRQHGDIRELLWLHVGDGWELRSGLGKVFWGVTESQHLVDVINQTDQIEHIDGERKLGQPMVHLTLLNDWGTLDTFILPGFREPRFPSVEGRLRVAIPIERGDTEFESSAAEHHLDFALRWSHTIDGWDIGLSYFDGTNRDANFTPKIVNQQLVLTPYYEQMTQVGLDLQSAVDSWLYKVEAIYRDTNQTSFLALNAGFEYSLVGVFDTNYDLGLLAEYQFDERDDNPVAPGQNDLFLGTRIGFNDADGTEILFGISQDLDRSSSRSVILEASSRINNNWKWRIDSWLFSAESPKELTYAIRRDDFIRFSLEYYF